MASWSAVSRLCATASLLENVSPALLPGVNCLLELRLLVLVGLVALSSGCSDGKGIVNGTVTFDGQPVASGMVTFVKQGGELAREGAVIKDGSFQALVPPGKYKLELNAQKVTGKRTQKGF